MSKVGEGKGGTEGEGKKVTSYRSTRGSNFNRAFSAASVGGFASNFIVQ